MSRQDSRKIEDVKVMLVKGANGSSILSIEKTSTSGVVDTYTVTLTDGTTSTFTVTNGSNIDSIEKTSSSGLVDTYTVTLTDGSTSTFEVTNGADGEDGADGRGIVSITKTGTQGLVDTYTITYTDGSTSTFTVTNADGSTMQENLATVETTNTASQPYAVGEFLVFGGRLCKVTTAIAQGDTLVIGTNIDYDTVGSELAQISADLSAKIGLWKVLSQGMSSAVTIPSDYNEIMCSLEQIGNYNNGVATSVIIPKVLLDSMSYGDRNSGRVAQLFDGATMRGLIYKSSDTQLSLHNASLGTDWRVSLYYR